MPTVADVIIKTLVNFGVKRIYAIPGDSLNPIIDAIRRNKDIKYEYSHFDCYQKGTMKELKRIVNLGFKDWKSPI